MIPTRLELENFLSYRQLATLDLSGVQLACIAGENGAGKSSLLDAITWALFGKCRAPGRDDVVNRQAVRRGQAARVQLDFELEGASYRVLRVQPAGKTGLLELQLLVTQDQFKSLTESTQTLTQARLAELLRMNYETFTNASFLLQGRADEFTVKRPGERKRILGELLGVGHWERYREDVAGRRKAMEREVAAMDGRLVEIGSELDQEAERERQLGVAREAHAAAQRQREMQARLVQSIQAYEMAIGQQRALVTSLANGLFQAREALARLEQTHALRREEREGLQAVLDQASDIEARYTAWQAAVDDLGRWDARANEWNRLSMERQQAVTAIEREKSRLETERRELERRREAVSTRRQERPALQTRLEQASLEAAALEEQLAEREHFQARQGELQAEIGAIKGEQPRLKAEMDELKQRQIQLQVEQSGRCPLCDQELTLDHQAAVIAQIEDEGRVLGDRFRANQARLAGLQEEMVGLRGDLERLSQLERQLRQVDQARTSLQTQLDEIERIVSEWESDGEPRLAAVQARLAEGRVSPEAGEAIARLEAALSELNYDPDVHATTRQQVADLAQAEADHRRLGEARAASRPLETTLQDLARQIAEQETQVEMMDRQHSEAQAGLDQLGPAPAAVSLPEAESELNRLREAEVIASKAVGAAEQSLLALDRLREQKGRLTAERQRAGQVIGRFKTLERAFGRDGVQALLIEQALPDLQESANELLDRLTGGAMRVSFSTQRPLKTREAMAETLDIHIADGAGERPYEMYSGGEAFRVNFAIRIALSRLLAQRAGARLQTLVIDEGFGSQDPEGRQRLVEAINEIQSDFAQVLVITHIDELKDHFPVRLQVTKGPQGSQVEID